MWLAKLCLTGWMGDSFLSGQTDHDGAQNVLMWKNLDPIVEEISLTNCLNTSKYVSGFLLTYFFYTS